MSDFIRIRFKDSKTEQSVPRPTALDLEAYDVLDEDAVDLNGQPLAPKFPAPSKPGQKATTTEKES